MSGEGVEADAAAPIVRERDGVRASAALTESGRAVRLTVTVTGDDTVVAVVAHDPPAGTGLASAAAGYTAGTDSVSLPPGHLELTATVAPGETVAVTYPLDDAPGDVAAPRVTAVVRCHPDDAPLAPVLHWVTGDEEFAMVARTGETHPLAGDGDGGDAVADVAVARAGEPVREGVLPESVRGVPASDRPAIGVVATRANADAAYGSILRATERGFDVFVASADDDAELRRLSTRLGATVVDVNVGAVDDGEATLRLERALSRAARTNGYPGIVFQAPSCPRIDYVATMAAFEANGFEVRATPARDVHEGEESVLVAIPAYEAERTIGAVVRETLTHCEEVLVVDDGSTDRTAAVAADAGAVVVRHPRNRGYGGALKTIFQEAARRGHDFVVTIDADGQHDPSDIPRLLAGHWRTGADVVVGSRYVEGSRTAVPRSRAIGLALVNGLTNISLGRFRPEGWLRDTQSGYRLYTREAAAAMVGASDVGDGMWASTDIIYHLTRERFSFAEVGTTIRYDLENTSSEGAIGHGMGLLRNIVGMLEHTHPLVLIGVPGLAAVVVGTGLGIVAIERALSGDPTVGGTLAATLVILLGVVMVGVASLFHVINTHPFFRNDRWE